MTPYLRSDTDLNPGDNPWDRDCFHTMILTNSSSEHLFNMSYQYVVERNNTVAPDLLARWENDHRRHVETVERLIDGVASQSVDGDSSPCSTVTRISSDVVQISSTLIHTDFDVYIVSLDCDDRTFVTTLGALHNTTLLSFNITTTWLILNQSSSEQVCAFTCDSYSNDCFMTPTAVQALEIRNYTAHAAFDTNKPIFIEAPDVFAPVTVVDYPPYNPIEFNRSNLGQRMVSTTPPVLHFLPPLSPVDGYLRATRDTTVGIRQVDPTTCGSDVIRLLFLNSTTSKWHSPGSGVQMFDTVVLRSPYSQTNASLNTIATFDRRWLQFSSVNDDDDRTGAAFIHQLVHNITVLYNQTVWIHLDEYDSLVRLPCLRFACVWKWLDRSCLFSDNGTSTIDPVRVSDRTVLQYDDMSVPFLSLTNRYVRAIMHQFYSYQLLDLLADVIVTQLSDTRWMRRHPLSYVDELALFHTFPVGRVVHAEPVNSHIENYDNNTFPFSTYAARNFIDIWKQNVLCSVEDVRPNGYIHNPRCGFRRPSLLDPDGAPFFVDDNSSQLTIGIDPRAFIAIFPVSSNVYNDSGWGWTLNPPPPDFPGWSASPFASKIDSHHLAPQLARIDFIQSLAHVRMSQWPRGWLVPQGWGPLWASDLSNNVDIISNIYTHKRFADSNSQFFVNPVVESSSIAFGSLVSTAAVTVAESIVVGDVPDVDTTRVLMYISTERGSAWSTDFSQPLDDPLRTGSHVVTWFNYANHSSVDISFRVHCNHNPLIIYRSDASAAILTVMIDDTPLGIWYTTKQTECKLSVSLPPLSIVQAKLVYQHHLSLVQGIRPDLPLYEIATLSPYLHLDDDVRRQLQTCRDGDKRWSAVCMDHGTTNISVIVGLRLRIHARDIEYSNYTTTLFSHHCMNASVCRRLGPRWIDTRVSLFDSIYSRPIMQFQMWSGDSPRPSPTTVTVRIHVQERALSNDWCAVEPDSFCGGRGMCMNAPNMSFCDCSAASTNIVGRQCQLEIDDSHNPCRDFVCNNSGVCAMQDSTSNPFCICPRNTYGDKCQFMCPTDSVLLQAVCGTTGRCIDLGGSIDCLCRIGSVFSQSTLSFSVIVRSNVTLLGSNVQGEIGIDSADDTHSWHGQGRNHIHYSDSLVVDAMAELDASVAGFDRKPCQYTFPSELYNTVQTLYSGVWCADESVRIANSTLVVQDTSAGAAVVIIRVLSIDVYNTTFVAANVTVFMTVDGAVDMTNSLWTGAVVCTSTVPRIASLIRTRLLSGHVWLFDAVILNYTTIEIDESQSDGSRAPGCAAALSTLSNATGCTSYDGVCSNTMYGGRYNRGVCVASTLNGSFCVCAAGFSGTYCEITSGYYTLPSSFDPCPTHITTYSMERSLTPSDDDASFVYAIISFSTVLAEMEILREYIPRVQLLNYRLNYNYRLDATSLRIDPYAYSISRLQIDNDSWQQVSDVIPFWLVQPDVYTLYDAIEQQRTDSQGWMAEDDGPVMMEIVPQLSIDQEWSERGVSTIPTYYSSPPTNILELAKNGYWSSGLARNVLLISGLFSERDGHAQSSYHTHSPSVDIHPIVFDCETETGILSRDARTDNSIGFPMGFNPDEAHSQCMVNSQCASDVIGSVANDGWDFPIYTIRRQGTVASRILSIIEFVYAAHSNNMRVVGSVSHGLYVLSSPLTWFFQNDRPDNQSDFLSRTHFDIGEYFDLNTDHWQYGQPATTDPVSAPLNLSNPHARQFTLDQIVFMMETLGLDGVAIYTGGLDMNDPDTVDWRGLVEALFNARYGWYNASIFFYPSASTIDLQWTTDTTTKDYIPASGSSASSILSSENSLTVATGSDRNSVRQDNDVSANAFVLLAATMLCRGQPLWYQGQEFVSRAGSFIPHLQQWYEADGDAEPQPSNWTLSDIGHPPDNDTSTPELEFYQAAMTLSALYASVRNSPTSMVTQFQNTSHRFSWSRWDPARVDGRRIYVFALNTSPGSGSQFVSVSTQTESSPNPVRLVRLFSFPSHQPYSQPFLDVESTSSAPSSRRLLGTGTHNRHVVTIKMIPGILVYESNASSHGQTDVALFFDLNGEVLVDPPNSNPGLRTHTSSESLQESWQVWTIVLCIAVPFGLIIGSVWVAKSNKIRNKKIRTKRLHVEIDEDVT